MFRVWKQRSWKKEIVEVRRAGAPGPAWPGWAGPTRPAGLGRPGLARPCQAMPGRPMPSHAGPARLALPPPGPAGVAPFRVTTDEFLRRAVIVDDRRDATLLLLLGLLIPLGSCCAPSCSLAHVFVFKESLRRGRSCNTATQCIEVLPQGG